MIHKSETTQLLKELVTIESQYFHEDKIMDYVKTWLCDRGMRAFIHHYHEAKVTDFHGKNVLLELDGGNPGPVICLNGHLDSVMLCKGWTRNPYGEIEGDRLYGLGALDMKSGCAALLVALEHFHRDYEQFFGKIKASFVSVEEGPYGMGTNAVIEDGYLEDVDFSIVTEPSAGFNGTPFPNLCLGARGGYVVTIELFGKSAHAGNPECGISAAEDAAAVVTALRDIEFIEDPNLGKGTCCVLAVESDGGACSVPDYASIKIFRHTVVGETMQTIEKELRLAVERAGIKGTCNIKFRDAPSENSKGFMPFTVSRDHPMIRSFVESVVEVTGREPTYSYFQSIGDFCYLGTRLHGAPAIIFGAAGEHSHGKDEYTELESVFGTAKTVYDFLVRVLTKK